MKTTNTKTTTREQKAIARSKEQVAKTTAKIEAVSNLDTITNQKANETMQAYLTHGKASDEFGKCLIELASIIAHCKLNQLINNDETYRQEFNTFKRDITISNKYFQYLATLETLFETRYNKNGDRVTVCTDKKRATQIFKLIENLSNNIGCDLVGDCYTRILATLDRFEKQGETITETTLLDPFEVYDLRSKYYRNSGHAKPQALWTKHATNAIKEASAEVSRSVTAQKNAREQTTLYRQLETTVTDETTGETETITHYKKASLFSAYEIADINGKQLATVSNEADDLFFDSIPEKAHLTTREAYILRYHYSENISLQEIADRLKITIEAVEKCDRNLKSKIVKANIFPQYANTERKTAQTAKIIVCYRADDETKTIIASFDSVGSASKATGIDKSLIAKVARGHRKTASNLVFAYQDN